MEKNNIPSNIDSKTLYKIAHRGGSGVAPENTMPAFENAFKSKMDVLEMDIHLTKNMLTLVIHDNTLNRTTNKKGNVNKIEEHELQEIDAGYHFKNRNNEYSFRNKKIQIPQLSDLFKKFGKKILYLIEIKSIDDPTDLPFLLDDIRESGMQNNVILGAGDPKIDTKLNSLHLDITTYFNLKESYKFVLFSKLFLLPFTSGWKKSLLCLPYKHLGFKVVTKSLVNNAHKLGIKVWVWNQNSDKTYGVNTDKEISELVEMGVDGIMTDYPDKLKNL